MKKLIVLSLSFGAILLSGCSREDLMRLEVGSPIVFTANTVYYSGTATRTEYSGQDENGNPVGASSAWERIDWVDSDLIRIWCDQEVAGSNNHFSDYKVTSHTIDNDDKKQSIATIEKTGANGFSWSNTNEHTFYALYPSPATTNVDPAKVKLEGNAISASIPAAQTVALKTGTTNFYKPDMNSAFMWAAQQASAGTKVNLGFKPLMTAFEFQFENDADTDMTFKSLKMSSSDAKLAGDFTATIGTDMETLTFGTLTNASNDVTVNFSSLTLASHAKLTVTLFALPQAIPDLTISVTINKDGADSTKSLALKQDKGSGMEFIPFTACKKYRITNLKVKDPDPVIIWPVTYDILTVGQEVDHVYEGSAITPTWTY